MKRFALAVLIAGANLAHAQVAVQAQDPVQTVVQLAPQLVAFAGSAENFYGLVVALTQGVPGRLSAPAAAGGFRRITALSSSPRLSAAQAAAVLERARQDLALLGIVQPVPEQIIVALAGGVLDTPTGRTQMRAALPPSVRLQVRAELEPDRRTPSQDELAFAQLPPEIQSLLRGMPPREALLRVEIAQQHLIALSNPSPSVAQLSAMVQYVLASPQAAVYVSASAGTTSFPPMSPLVPPYLPAMR